MGSPLELRGNAFFASNRFEDVVVGLRRAEQLLRASAAHLSFRTLLPRGPWLSWQSLALIQLPSYARNDCGASATKLAEPGLDSATKPGV